MQRRGKSGRPGKGQRASRPKARKAPIAHVSINSPEQFDRLKRERDEALEQLAATSDVLQFISRSAFDLKSVLQTLVELAARLCKADKAAMTRQIGGEFFFAEVYGFSPEFIKYVRTLPVKPQRGTVTGLALLEGRPFMSLMCAFREIALGPRRRGSAASVRCSAFRCCAKAGQSAFWDCRVRKFSHSPISRSSWCRTSPLRPSLPLRTHVCSTN